MQRRAEADKLALTAPSAEARRFRNRQARTRADRDIVIIRLPSIASSLVPANCGQPSRSIIEIMYFEVGTVYLNGTRWLDPTETIATESVARDARLLADYLSSFHAGIVTLTGTDRPR